MENQKLHDWERAVDLAENQPLTADLPTDYPLGGHYYQETPNERSRDWLRVIALSGKVGARWAYWAPWFTINPHSGQKMAGVGPHPEYAIVADTLFNGDAPHFVGMLGIPFIGKFQGPQETWVLISPRMTPPPEQKIYEEKKRERYERSHEIYDVETGTATPLPGRQR